jgi:hypothetical protein
MRPANKKQWAILESNEVTYNPKINVRKRPEYMRMK